MCHCDIDVWVSVIPNCVGECGIKLSDICVCDIELWYVCVRVISSFVGEYDIELYGFDNGDRGCV